MSEEFAKYINRGSWCEAVFFRIADLGMEPASGSACRPNNCLGHGSFAFLGRKVSVGCHQRRESEPSWPWRGEQNAAANPSSFRTKELDGIRRGINHQAGGLFLVIEKCMPHNCPSAFATIVIDLNQKRLWVGLFSRDETRTSTRWYGNADDYSVLPEVIRQGFVDRHEGFMPQHVHY